MKFSKPFRVMKFSKPFQSRFFYNIIVVMRPPSNTDKCRSPAVPGHPAAEDALLQQYTEVHTKRRMILNGVVQVFHHTHRDATRHLFDGGVIVLWSHLFPFYAKENEGEKESYSCNVLPNVHGNEHCRL